MSKNALPIGNKLKRLFSSQDSTNRMILFLSFSNIISNALTIISGILVARWLLPEELGFFNAFTLLVGYVILAQIGLPSGLSREFPLLMSQGEEGKAKDYASITQFWQIVLGSSSFVLLTMVALVLAFINKPDYAAGTFVLGVLIFQAFYITKYLKILYRTNHAFNDLSKINLINAFVLFASIVFVWKYGFYGLCLRAIIGVSFDFFFTWRWRPLSVRPTWDRGRFRELLKIGFPMYAVSNIYGLWPVLQRTAVLILAGPKGLGLFAVAVIVENAMKAVTSSVSSVAYPQLMAEWGRGASMKSLIGALSKPVFFAGGLFLLLVPLGWNLMPWVIATVLPNYVGATVATQWMLLVGLAGVLGVLANIYNVVNRQIDRLIMYSCGVLGWLLTLYCLHLYRGLALEHFPMAMVAGFVIMFIVNVYHLYSYRTLRHVR